MIAHTYIRFVSINSRPCNKALLTMWPALYIGVGIRTTGCHYDSKHDLGVVGAAH